MHSNDTAAITGNPFRRFRDNSIPFLTSLCVHAAIVLVGVLMFRAITSPRQVVFEEQAVTPDGMVFDSLAGPAVSAAPAAMNRPEFDEPADEHRERIEERARESSAPRADPLNIDEPASDASLVNGGPKLSMEPQNSGANRSRVPFGTPNTNGVGRGPASIFGTGGRGWRGGDGGDATSGGGAIRSVVYVCDASGSMVDKFAALREQLRRGVDSLKPIQAFNVIFFRDERAAAMSTGELPLALPASRRKFERFLDDVYPSGQTDPIPALEIAFKQKPDLIFLLTDGDFPNNTAVLEFIRRRNGSASGANNARVRINTIAFVDRGDGYEKVLQTIASENRGTFRFVAADDLP